MANRLLARLAIGIAVVAGAFCADGGSPSAHASPKRGADYVAYPVSRPARFPIRWRIGKIDPRFNLDTDQVKGAAERAIRVWEDESGKRLFVYDEKAGFPVNLEFDARQSARNARRDREKELDAAKLALERTGQNQRDALERFNRAQVLIGAETETYYSELNAYNSRVDHWNASGGAPPDVVAQLEVDKENLAAARSRLRRSRKESDGLLSESNRLVEAYNDLSERYNQSAEMFNRAFGSTITQEVGECLMSGSRPKSVSIHAFQDSNDLAVVLAHEFGHALGLKHVQGDGALMSEVETVRDAIPDLRLTDRDKAELRRALAR